VAPVLQHLRVVQHYSLASEPLAITLSTAPRYDDTCLTFIILESHPEHESFHYPLFLSSCALGESLPSYVLITPLSYALVFVVLCI
jgi:hypothetical protein